MIGDANVPTRAAQSGMSLIELLVVVVIVGILAGIAYPSYRKQVVRSTRTDAKVSLQQSAQALEDCFTRFHEYDHDDCVAMTALLSVTGRPSNDGHYTITAEGEDDLTFTLVATPRGGQAADTECANFTLDQTNVRGVTGTKGATQAGITECWR
jgi:type IV pilus assembly protein PilE